MNLMKKGAMFGLDARIALAIFGALSVISGAALYSAIESAKAEQWRQYLEEVIKSTEQYYLDNGSQLAVLSTGSFTLYAGDMITNRESLSTWKGPYLSTSSSTTGYFMDSATSRIHSNSFTKVFLRQSSTWTEMNDNNTDEFCVVNDPDCSEWISIAAGSSTGTPNLLDIFNKLDKLVDGSDGALSGKVRYNTDSSDFIMYKGMPHKRSS